MHALVPLIPALLAVDRETCVARPRIAPNRGTAALRRPSPRIEPPARPRTPTIVHTEQQACPRAARAADDRVRAASRAVDRADVGERVALAARGGLERAPAGISQREPKRRNPLALFVDRIIERNNDTLVGSARPERAPEHRNRRLFGSRKAKRSRTGRNTWMFGLHGPRPGPPRDPSRMARVKRL